MQPHCAMGGRTVISPLTMDPAGADKRYLWHPFTQMREWCAAGHEPIVIVSGDGAVLRDDRGREYLDGNASIWTNIHGHRHPRIDAAIRTQLDRIAHCSALGLTNDVAPRLAEKLIGVFGGEAGHRVFFSGDGSSAMEAALKMAFQARAHRGEAQRTRFLSLGGAYHGDTVGAMSLGHSGAFHQPFAPLMFETTEVMPPACYRCPFNRARPTRGQDARETRACGWECANQLREAIDAGAGTTAAFALEPRVQGAAGMLMHPHGYIAKAAALCRDRGIWLIADEILTGFGRTGAMFACAHEGVRPDLVALGKGLSGGYLPLAATLASGEIFDAFLGKYAEFRTFFHGHSYTANPLACAAALANIETFETDQTLERLPGLADILATAAAKFWEHPSVGDVRQEGMILAIELVEDFDSRRPFPAEARLGHRVCEAAKGHGLLTRPILNTLVLMPPLCASPEQIRAMGDSLWRGLCEVLPP